MLQQTIPYNGGTAPKEARNCCEVRNGKSVLSNGGCVKMRDKYDVITK